MAGLDKEIREFHNTKFSQPFVHINFHIPGTKAYEFYASGRFIKEYCENAKIHQPRDGVAEQSYNYAKYMQNEKGHGDVVIPVVQSENAGKGKVAEQSIVFDSVISICEEDTKNIGLLDKQKNITEYFFNQFCESHKFDKSQWAYFSALHTNTDNDHLHIVFFQPQETAEKKIVVSKFLESQKFATYDKSSDEFKSYVLERRKIITFPACLKKVQNHLGMMLDKTFNCEELKKQLKLINEMKIETKRVIQNSKDEKVLLDLTRSIAEKKGMDGRLQYANLAKWAKIKPDERNPGAVENQKNTKILLKEVDAAVDYFMKDEKVVDRINSTFASFREILGINKTPGEVNDVFKYKLRKQYYDEQIVGGTRMVIANAILSEVKTITYEQGKLRKKDKWIKKHKFAHPKFVNQKSSSSREYVFKENQYTGKAKKSILDKLVSYNAQLEYENMKYLRMLNDEWIKSQMEKARQENLELEM